MDFLDLKTAGDFNEKNIVSADHNFTVIRRRISTIVLCRVNENDVHVGIHIAHLPSIFKVHLQSH